MTIETRSIKQKTTMGKPSGNQTFANQPVMYSGVELVQVPHDVVIQNLQHTERYQLIKVDKNTMQLQSQKPPSLLTSAI